MPKQKQPITDWNPEPNWLLVEPTKLPDKTEGGLILPEEFKTKQESGIVFKVGDKSLDRYIGREVFFPRHQEYQIVDSETNRVFYAINFEHILLWRVPPAPQKFYSLPKTEEPKLATDPTI